MDSLAVNPTELGNYAQISLHGNSAQAQANSLAIQSIAHSNDDSSDAVSVDLSSTLQGLPVTAQKILEKLNELLKKQLPEGIQSLKPEDHTPEMTAERIVSGVTGFFDIYSKQHPELEGEDLVSGFMDTIRSGIQAGYDDAFETLKGLGAFELDGIQSGVEKTKVLIEEKLQSFEKSLRSQLGLSSGLEAELAQSTSTAVLTQAATQIRSGHLDLAA